MSDIVFSCKDYPTLLAEVQRLGWVFRDAEGVDQILPNGFTQSGVKYYLNYVGEVLEPTGDMTTDVFGNAIPVLAPLPGVWGRLRLHAPVITFSGFSSEVTQFYFDMNKDMWTTDGQTAAPSYVASIGAIA